MAQATASLYGVKTYPEQLAFKEKALMEDLFLKLPATIRFVYSHTIRERDVFADSSGRFPCADSLNIS